MDRVIDKSINSIINNKSTQTKLIYDKKYILILHSQCISQKYVCDWVSLSKKCEDIASLI